MALRLWFYHLGPRGPKSDAKNRSLRVNWTGSGLYDRPFTFVKSPVRELTLALAYKLIFTNVKFI